MDYLKTLLLYLIPHHALSRLMRAWTRITWAPLRRWQIRIFRRLYPVNLDEAANPDPNAYASFNAFFTRELKATARPIEGDADTLVCPADGAIARAGDIVNGELIQAKGHHFTVEDLLGGDATLAAEFAGGQFATVYLSPVDYHRVHMPLAGRLRQSCYVPGRLFSVSPATCEQVPRLFARNERLVCTFDGEQGPFVMVLVGAIFVSGIETVWAPGEPLPRNGEIECTDWTGPEVELARGAEMGRFNMGSTVILLLPPGSPARLGDLVPGHKVRMGQRLGH